MAYQSYSEGRDVVCDISYVTYDMSHVNCTLVTLSGISEMITFHFGIADYIV